MNERKCNEETPTGGEQSGTSIPALTNPVSQQKQSQLGTPLDVDASGAYQ